MKQILFSLLLAVTIVTGSSPIITAKPTEQSSISIIIYGGSEIGEGLRSPQSTPISGTVIGNTILIIFSRYVGDVNTSLDKSTEGHLLNTVLDSADTYSFIPFSGAEGEYTLTFTLEDGTNYYGRFEIL